MKFVDNEVELATLGFGPRGQVCFIFFFFLQFILIRISIFGVGGFVLQIFVLACLVYVKCDSEAIKNFAGIVF